MYRYIYVLGTTYPAIVQEIVGVFRDAAAATIVLHRIYLFGALNSIVTRLVVVRSSMYASGKSDFSTEYEIN